MESTSNRREFTRVRVNILSELRSGGSVDISGTLANVSLNGMFLNTTIINDILDFSKIEAGKFDLECIDFDLRPLVEDTMELMADQTQRKGLELTCLIQATVPAVMRGDPGRLRQVLTNLVGNAIKFTPQGDVMAEWGFNSLVRCSPGNR